MPNDGVGKTKQGRTITLGRKWGGGDLRFLKRTDTEG